MISIALHVLAFLFLAYVAIIVGGLLLGGLFHFITFLITWGKRK